MAITEVIAASLIAGIIQVIQSWMAMARQSGLTDSQITNLMDEQFAIFLKNIATPLPDPDKEIK